MATSTPNLVKIAEIAAALCRACMKASSEEIYSKSLICVAAFLRFARYFPVYRLKIAIFAHCIVIVVPYRRNAQQYLSMHR